MLCLVIPYFVSQRRAPKGIQKGVSQKRFFVLGVGEEEVGGLATPGPGHGEVLCLGPGDKMH